MSIRLATLEDTNVIQSLIYQLGFPHSNEFIREKIQRLLNSPNDTIFVYEKANKVVGLITVHFSIQLAFDGDFMSIGYFVVDENYRRLKIGETLDNYVTNLAKEKGCSTIEVFSQAKRTDAHRFYERQGYIVSEKFFSKEL